MLRFRPGESDAITGDLADPLAVAQVIDDAMRPGHFFVAADLDLTWIAARAETIPWEIFRGRLVDESQTREQKSFLSWHVLEQDEPTISVKFDVRARQIHVTRGLRAYVWEGYDAGGGVIESREVVKWTRELVGSIALADFRGLADLRDELICLIWQAVVGTSRLPLTSVEAPLPAFSFGQMHYVYRSDAGTGPLTSWQDLVSCWSQPDLSPAERAKLLEFVLRGSFNDALRFLEAHGHTQVLSMALWRAMFNSVSLSPYTHFAESALNIVALGASREQALDFYAHQLFQLCRHLTAYDLVTFHHRGANYPDALLLDSVLKRYLRNVATWPELFQGSEPERRKRRRALRESCLLRRHYEGHLVPDVPTSPGENARVMPASHPRVPEDQLTLTTRRRRQLFADDPLVNLLADPVRSVLGQSIADLEHPDERGELGLGLFIDRPLGYAKAIGEPDLTPMLAHEAFSPAIARRRWQELKNLCAELAIACDTAALDPLFANGAWPAGLPHGELAECPRPSVALADVRRVADDLVIIRTMPIGLARMLEQLDLVAILRERYRLGFLDNARLPRLCVQVLDDNKQAVLAIFDDQLRRRVELRVDASQGYTTRAGVELPNAGVRVVAVWEDTDDPTLLAKREVEC